MPKSMHELNIEFIKPLIVAGFAVWITHLDEATSVFKFLSVVVAFGYAVWKWSKDAKKQ